MQQFAAVEIGERIARARREADGMTQAQLAELLNVSVRSVQDYEAGVTIPWRYFRLMEGIFKKPMAWFLHGEELKDATTEERLGRIEGRLEEILERLEEPGEGQAGPARG